MEVFTAENLLPVRSSLSPRPALDVEVATREFIQPAQPENPRIDLPTLSTSVKLRVLLVEDN
jgi:hypothetical protein